MRKVSYTIIKKSRRPNAPWYIRRRTGGTQFDVNLETTDRSIAETELMRVKVAQAELDRGGLEGDTLDALAVRRKGLSEPVSAPGGVLDRWEAKMSLEGLRRGTVDRYGRAARFLLKKESPDTLTPGKVAAVMAGTAGLKSNTRRGYADALRSLFRFMGRDDLARALPRVRTETGDRTVWTREDMAAIISCVSSRSAERTLQYREYFGMMAAIGSRQGETYALRWGDISEDGVVHFRAETTKSRKERFCPLPTDLFAELELRRKGDLDPLWPDIGSDQATRFAALSLAVRRAGVRKGGLHTFRHSVSTILYRECLDIKLVSQLLGHSPQVALQYYQAARGVEEMRGLVER